jgi:hypothetical protein
MRPTKRLEARARICVECHVGSPGRDVNHDLIAAGHPRLNFEFAAFLANMPPHWVEKTGGNFPAQAWAIGQATTARAAADLLARRAGDAGRRRSPWPEFSEYDCFACHHDLADEPWRQSRAATGRTPGIPAWGTWCYPEALTLARQESGDRRPELESAFAALDAEMAHFGSDPAKVAGAAQALYTALGRWLQTLPNETRGYDAAKVKSLIDAVQKADPAKTTLGWDRDAQRYLALQMLHLTLEDLDPASTGRRARESERQALFDSLKFPRGFDSPRSYPAQPSGNR